MKNFALLLVLFLSILILLSSCMGSQAPTSVDGLEIDPTGADPVPANPILQTVDLAGLAAGTMMKWYDQNELIFIPAGKFVMGGQKDVPERKVTLSSYWIYRFPVTNGMYYRCVQSGACDPPAVEPPYPDFTDVSLKDYPVVGVTWDQAGAYCGWMDGRQPTEAEWEKAARGEDGSLYPWGPAEPGCELANYADCWNQTSRVTDLPAGASPYGVYDMSGNVYEWVSDWFGTDFLTTPDENPQGPDTGDQRVLRSSSYKSGADLLPVARRFSLEPESYREDLGFRCVVQDPQEVGFAPYCQVSAVFVPPDGSERCEVSPVTIDPTGFCVDRDANIGGVNIRVYSDSRLLGAAVGGTDCTHVGDDYSSGFLVTCSGPENSSFSFTQWAQCYATDGYPLATPACGDGYTISADGNCNFVGYSGGPAPACPAGFIHSDAGTCTQAGTPSEKCPVGFNYDASAGCCSQTSADPLLSYRGCPVGYEYYPEESVCSNMTVRRDDFTVQFGDCPEVGGGGSSGGSRCPAGQSWVCNLTNGKCSCQ